jgi:hypothetical protein
MAFLNQFSFLLFAGIPVALVLLLLLRGQGTRLKQLLALALVAAVAAVFLLFRPGASGVTVSGEAAFQRMAALEKPTLVEVYSDY